MAQPEVLTAADEAAEEAAFEAGFNEEEIQGLGNIEPEPTPPADDTTPSDEPPADPAQPAAVAPVEQQTFTMADVQALLAQQKQEFDAAITKTQDKLFGKLGEFNQKIEAARTQAAGISPQARERLEEQFPELAEMLFDGAPAPAAAAPVVDTPVPVVPAIPVDPEVLKEQLRQELAIEKVLDTHEDYYDVIQDERFHTWAETVLDHTLAAELTTTWQPRTVSKRLTEFKGWLAAQAAMQQKTDALAAAVTPRGVPRSVAGGYDDDDEEAAMLKAFNPR